MPDISPEVLARRQKDAEGFVDQYHALLDERERRYFKEIGPVWDRTRQRLNLQIKALFKKYADGQGRLSESKLSALRNKIGGLDALQREYAAIFGLETPALSEKIGNQLSYEYARSLYYNAFGLEQAARIEIKVPTASTEQVLAVVNNPWLGDGKTYSDRIRQNAQFLADKAYQVVGKTIVEGWDVNTASRTLAGLANEGYFNSVRLIRTELTRVTGQAQSALYMENADVLDGKRWVATLDGRTAARDARNDSKVYDLDYDTVEKPGRPGERIPNHPHCRCRWAPILSALGISRRERIARKGDTSDDYGERDFTPARTYEAYAEKRSFPKLEERLAAENPKKYLRRGETMQDFGPLAGKTPTTTPSVTPEPAPAPVKQAYTPLNDTKKATAWAKASLPIDYVNYKGFAPELADDINTTLDGLYCKFPEMAGRTKIVTTIQERNRRYVARRTEEIYRDNLGKWGNISEAEVKKMIAKRIAPQRPGPQNWASSTNHTWGPESGICYNEKFTKNYSVFSRATAHCAKSGFHPPGTENPASVLTHEFGHQLDYFLQEKGLRDGITKLAADWRSTWVMKKRPDALQMAWDTLSEYAMENDKEFFAEAFAEYLHSPNPRPIAQQVGKAVEEAFAKLRKGGKP